MTHSAPGNGSNGSNGGNNFLSRWTSRDLIVLAMALGSLYSGLGIALYQLRDVKENYVSKTDLQVSDLSTPQGVTAEQIKELTDQLKLTSQEVEALRQIEEKHTQELQRQNDALLKQEGRR